MKDCIFCKIVKGEIPSSTIYEDDLVKVFLDVNPTTNGHMLIIPKKHYQDLFEIDNSILVHSIDLIKQKLYPLVKEKLHCDGLTITQNNGYGQEVKHFHIHVMPRYENDFHYHVPNEKMIKPIDEIFTSLK